MFLSFLKRPVKILLLTHLLIIRGELKEGFEYVWGLNSTQSETVFGWPLSWSLLNNKFSLSLCLCDLCGKIINHRDHRDTERGRICHFPTRVTKDWLALRLIEPSNTLEREHDTHDRKRHDRQDKGNVISIQKYYLSYRAYHAACDHAYPVLVLFSILFSKIQF